MFREGQFASTKARIEIHTIEITYHNAMAQRRGGFCISVRHGRREAILIGMRENDDMLHELPSVSEYRLVPAAALRQIKAVCSEIGKFAAMLQPTFLRSGALLLFLGIAGPTEAQPVGPSSSIETLLAQENFNLVEEVRVFYRQRSFAPAWSGSPTAETNARQALAALSHAGEDGLDQARYEILAPPAGGPAARDVVITAAVLKYMQEVKTGRFDLERLDFDVALPAQQFDAVAALAGALLQDRLGSILAGLAPPHLEYATLKSALAHYRAIAARGGWPLLPVNTNFTGKDAPLLLQRLSYEDSSVAITPQGANLAPAIKRFQAHHGLEPDGVVGIRTLAELNVPAAARAEAIGVNMERWRWLSPALEADRIVINVPDARLQLWLNGAAVLISRVIVGRPHDPTPILRAEGAGVTINPPWTIPASIAVREILPKLKKNPSYLASQDMVLLDGPPGDPQGLHVNWRAIRDGTFPYRIRQHAGPRNPLGSVKLELPNKFDVYLHDTPGKSIFALASRGLSHGCVRVEEILPLASYALAADLSSVDKIARMISSGDTKYLPLDRKLPVYFLYWTAFTDVNGVMEFRPDLYGRDQRLIAAMTVHLTQLAGDPVKCSRG
jgi:murein L,D-transpeptidase YcbB/YkuD